MTDPIPPEWPRFWGIVEGVDRRWSVEDHGPSKGSRRYLATDITSAIAATEWITADQLVGSPAGRRP